MWVPVFCSVKGTRTTPDTLSKSHVPAGFWSNSLVAALLATETTPEHGFFSSSTPASATRNRASHNVNVPCRVTVTRVSVCCPTARLTSDDQVS